MKKVINFLNGFFMAFADSVPGVSGGTVAFLLGFFDKFINSLNNILSGKFNEKKKAVYFLFNLAIGWSVGFVIATLILGNMFETHIYALSSLFLGFVLFAIPIVILEEKNTLKRNYGYIVFTVIGAVIVFAISRLTNYTVINGIDLNALSFGSGVYIFVCGAIAISAMVLPGISGSTLLLIFGLYIPIMTAIKDLLGFDFSCLTAIIIFGVGILTGLFSVIKLIKKALDKFRAQTIYLIIGLMIGSLYSIIIGPTTLEVPQSAMSLSTFNVLTFIAGGAVIFGMQYLKRIQPKKETLK